MDTYFAYLLRIWQAGSPEQPAWRLSLEDPHTRLVISFSGVEALALYLANLIADSQGGSRPALDDPFPSPGG